MYPSTPLTDVIHAQPVAANDQLKNLRTVFENLITCEYVCRICADACLAQGKTEEFDDCIRATQACSEVCGTTALLLFQLVPGLPSAQQAQLRACSLVCKMCAELCSSQGTEQEHFNLCADMCRRSHQQCDDAVDFISRCSNAFSPEDIQKN